MSFHINWNAFASHLDFQNHIRELLTTALNKSKPHILEDKINVLNLDWGTEAPTLELLEVGDIAADRFRGVFKLNYTGGATITVSTKVQANLLNVSTKSSMSKFITPKYVGALSSFPIPLNLTLRNIRLQGTVIVVFNKARGLTLVFRNDPLQSIEVSSTFDTFPIIASFLQQQIETQIRTLFREEVPSVLYQLSLKYLPNVSGTSQQLSQEQSAPKTKFADIDYGCPVSLMNILHIEAMGTSRMSLALNTPIMPTAIVRSQLPLWTSKASPFTTMLDIASDDTSIYEKIYAQSKHSMPRSARKPKRRVVTIRGQASATQQKGVSEEAHKPAVELPLEKSSTPVGSHTQHSSNSKTQSKTQTTTQTMSAPPDNAPTITSTIQSPESSPKKFVKKLRGSEYDRITANILLKRLQKRLSNAPPTHFGTNPFYVSHRPNFINMDKLFPGQPFFTSSETGTTSIYPISSDVSDVPPPAYNG